MGQCVLEMGRLSFHTIPMNANLSRRITAFRPRFLATVSTAITVGLLSGCVPPPATAPKSTPTQAPSAPIKTPNLPPPPAHRGDWRDAPATPGNWSYTSNPAGSLSTFGGGVFAIRCAPQSQTITLIRGQSAVTHRAQQIAVRIDTSNLSHTLSGHGTPNGVEITLPARDPVLDAMAFSRGRFAVSINGDATLYIPSWPEISKVIEDCR